MLFFVSKVRQYCAEQLYLQLLGLEFEGEEGEKLEKAMEILSETEWIEPLGKTKEERTKVREILNFLTQK